jgi:hypothetical protein
MISFKFQNRSTIFTKFRNLFVKTLRKYNRDEDIGASNHRDSVNSGQREGSILNLGKEKSRRELFERLQNIVNIRYAVV